MRAALESVFILVMACYVAFGLAVCVFALIQKLREKRDEATVGAPTLQRLIERQLEHDDQLGLVVDVLTLPDEQGPIGDARRIALAELVERRRG